MAKLPLRPLALWQVAREVKAANERLKPLVVAGAEGPATELADALAAGGDRHWVRVLAGRLPAAYDLEGAGALVLAVAGARPGSEEEDALRLAARKDVPVVCVLADAGPGAPVDVPYVLATDVVAVAPGAPAPVDAVVERLASRLGDGAYGLAGRLPVLRRAVCEHVVRTFSRRNAVIGVAVFVPGADFPLLTLNQVRMVLRLAGAFGVELDRERAVEVLGVVGAGLGFRAAANELLGLVPFGGWALKGGVAYAGTRAIGEAAVRYFEAGGIDSVRSRS